MQAGIAVERTIRQQLSLKLKRRLLGRNECERRVVVSRLKRGPDFRQATERLAAAGWPTKKARLHADVLTKIPQSAIRNPQLAIQIPISGNRNRRRRNYVPRFRPYSESKNRCDPRTRKWKTFAKVSSSRSEGILCLSNSPIGQGFRSLSRISRN
jgi:hypothetical protein